MVVGVAHQGPGDPVTAVCRADVEPPDLCRASAGQGSEADAAGGLSSEIGDQEDSRRAVDALQAAAFTLKYGGKLADASWHWPSGLGLGRCHVLEDRVRASLSRPTGKALSTLAVVMSAPPTTSRRSQRKLSLLRRMTSPSTQHHIFARTNGNSPPVSPHQVASRQLRCQLTPVTETSFLLLDVGPSISHRGQLSVTVTTRSPET